MQAFGLARLGKDAALRHTANGDAVVGLALAFTWGPKGADGKRQTAWVDGSFWGKRAEALAPYLLKGSQVSITLEDLHIETYESQGAQGHKLVGKVLGLDLVSNGQQQPAAAPAPKPAPRPMSKQATAPAPAFADMDDDIPF